MGRFSKIRHPWVCRLSTRLHLATLHSPWISAKLEKQTFESVHDCFTRELVPGARPIEVDPGVLTSPCDAIVGAHGNGGVRHRAPGQGFSLPH